MWALLFDSLWALKRMIDAAILVVLRAKSIFLEVMPVHAYAYHIGQGVW
jgi:hypothetical protein